MFKHYQLFTYNIVNNSISTSRIQYLPAERRIVKKRCSSEPSSERIPGKLLSSSSSRTITLWHIIVLSLVDDWNLSVSRSTLFLQEPRLLVLPLLHQLELVEPGGVNLQLVLQGREELGVAGSRCFLSLPPLFTKRCALLNIYPCN